MSAHSRKSPSTAATRRAAHWFLPLLGGLLLLPLLTIGASPAAQLATATPSGPEIVVPELVNVRTGPSTGPEYELIGVLTAGQRARALGRSPGGDWIQIEYLGVPGNVAWVYSPNVVIEPASATLPIVEPPPTATPEATATIDPTLAAQFNLGAPEPTRLPTFTPAAPVIQPTFPPPQDLQASGFPPILAIAGLLMLGMFGTLISFLRGG
jgi:hypothetical protein